LRLAAEDEHVVGEAVVDGDEGGRREAIEREREAPRCREVQRGVTLAPVLDERDVAPGLRGHAHAPTSATKASKPAARQAATTAPSAPAAMTAPPPPAPVSLAPAAPARLARAQSASSLAVETARVCRRRCAASKRPPRARGSASAPRPSSARPPSS